MRHWEARFTAGTAQAGILVSLVLVPCRSPGLDLRRAAARQRPPCTPLGLTPKLLSGAGVYADIKLTTTSAGNDPYYLDDVTVDQAELAYADRRVDDQSNWVSVNLALVMAVSRDFAVYGGAGYR